jgi:hypothetical protein
MYLTAPLRSRLGIGASEPSRSHSLTVVIQKRLLNRARKQAVLGGQSGS